MGMVERLKESVVALKNAPGEPDDEVHRAPRPDLAGGAVVRVPAGTRRVVVTGSALKAVDIVAEPGLREVDVSDCGPGVHLTVFGTPDLARLVLPATGPGAVLHLDVGAPIDELQVVGPTDLVDIAWRTAGGSARGTYVDAPRGQPFDGGWLGAAPKKPAMAGLVVVTGGEAPADLLSDCGFTTSHVVIESCSAPGGLDLPAPLRHVQLRDVDTPRLNVPDTVHLRLDGCRGLARIDGRAERIVLRGGDSGARLDIDAWTDLVDLSGVKAGALGVSGVARLEAGDTHHIGRLDKSRHRPGFEVVVAGGGAPQGVAGDGAGESKVRPLTASDVERQFAEKGGFGQAAMLRWAAGCDQPSQLWLALHVLSMAVDHGHDAAECWKSRCELLLRHKRQDYVLRRAPGTSASWNWNFPDDLAVRGWTGDLRLWLRAVAGGVPEAMTWVKTFAASTAPAQVCSLLTVAASPDVTAEESRLLRELASGALLRAAEPPPESRRTRKHRVEVAGAADLGWLHLGARALVTLAVEPDTGDLAAAFARWTQRLAPTPEGVRLLDQLASHGCEQAGRSLLGLRRSLDVRRDLNGAQRQALANALKMVLLAPSAKSDPTFSPETVGQPPAVEVDTVEADTVEADAVEPGGLYVFGGSFVPDDPPEVDFLEPLPGEASTLQPICVLRTPATRVTRLTDRFRAILKGE